MAGSASGRESFEKVEENGGCCAIDWRAKARRARPFRVRVDANMTQIWVGNGSAGGRKANARPFGLACRVDFSVRNDPNRRARTKWVGALKLLQTQNAALS